MKLESIIATEVLVPAHPGKINSPSLHRPLHKLATHGFGAWTVQFDEVPKLILQLHWDNGIVGYGECYRGHDWLTIEQISRALLGKPISIICLQELPIPWCREHDGFECAIWDSYAKRHELRVVDLLGGPIRERIPVGAWSGHRVVEEIAELAAQFAEQGYDCLKFKCDLDDDVAAWCSEIARTAPKLKVILDPNERWEWSFEVKRRLDDLAKIGNVLCIEDPLPRWMLREYRELRAYSRVPIVLHVSLPYHQHGQKVEDAILAIQHSAVDGFNFNCGLAKFQQLDHIASAAHLPCWHGSEIDLGILEAMYLHSCAAAKSCIWPSDIFGRLIRSHDLLTRPLDITPPFATLPDGLGLGVEPDMAAVREHQRRQEVFTA